MSPHRICVFGLGEAGSEIAAGLVEAGTVVHAYDPKPVATPPGVSRFTEPGEAVAGVSAILSVTAARDSETAITQALDRIPGGSLYADLATASPELKRRLASLTNGSGIRFADVALMGTLPGNGLRTPTVVSGPGAGEFAELMSGMGMPVEVVSGEPGAAAAHKLLRSVVIKGLGALLIEAMKGATARGVSDATWDNLVAQLTGMDEGFLLRLIEGSETHAERRLDEMSAVVDLLTDSGVDPVMSEATRRLIEEVRSTGLPEVPRRDDQV